MVAAWWLAGWVAGWPDGWVGGRRRQDNKQSRWQQAGGAVITQRSCNSALCVGLSSQGKLATMVNSTKLPKWSDPETGGVIIAVVDKDLEPFTDDVAKAAPLSTHVRLMCTHPSCKTAGRGLKPYNGKPPTPPSCTQPSSTSPNYCAPMLPACVQSRHSLAKSALSRAITRSSTPPSRRRAHSKQHPRFLGLSKQPT